MSDLRYLLIAVFLLFAAIGPLRDADVKGTMSLAAVVLWSLTAGGFAILYAIVSVRNMKLMPLVILAQLAVNFGCKRLIDTMAPVGYFQPVQAEKGLHLAVLTTMMLVVSSYAFFVIFIQTSGRRVLRAEAELRAAHGIQTTLVPEISHRDARFETFAMTSPSEKVGGDVVDIVADGDTLFCYVVDVSGHGLQAGILMGMIKTSVRTLLLDNAGLSDVQDKLNRVLPAVKESQMYATFAGLRFRSEDVVEYAIAGHHPMLHWRSATRDFALLGTSQLPLGMFSDVRYETVATRYQSGDVFVITTDGILEVENESGEEFSVARLQRIVEANPEASAATAVSAIMSEIKSFGKQIDDQTILYLRVL